MTVYNDTPPPYSVPRDLEIYSPLFNPHPFWWACTLQSAQPDSRWPTQSSEELMSTLTRRHSHWPASKSTPAAGTCIARAATSTTSCRRVFMDPLPAPLAFSIRHRDDEPRLPNISLLRIWRAGLHGLQGRLKYFQDYTTLSRLQAPGLTPGLCKALGRQVVGFDDEQWNAVRYDLMLRVRASTPHLHTRRSRLDPGAASMPKN